MEITKYIPGTRARRQHVVNKAADRFFLKTAVGVEIEITNQADVMGHVEEHIDSLNLHSDVAGRLRQEAIDALSRESRYGRKLLLIAVDERENATAAYL